MTMEKVEVVVVGGGLAGLAAAYVLAEAGVEVLVVERGDYSGAKNVSGGRLYLEPVRPYLPDLWDGAPFERRVVKERLTMMAPESSLTVELNGSRFRGPPPHSVTVLRATFDQWLAERVGEKGALVIPGYQVDDVLMQDGRVVGIRSGDAELQADVVVAADGVLSFTAERAGLRRRHDPQNLAVGVKEVIELPEETIQDRFGLQAGYFTRDLDKANYAFEHTECGAVLINESPIARLDHLPYGGVKDSGFGREGLRWAMDELTEPRLFVVKPGW